MERIVYRFQHRRTGTEVVLEMEDRAGKDYEELVEESQQRLAEAAGLVLLFDPTRSPAALEREVWETLESVHIAAAAAPAATSARSPSACPRPTCSCAAPATSSAPSPIPTASRGSTWRPACSERSSVSARTTASLPASSAGVCRRWGVVEPQVFYDESLRPRIATDGGMPVNVMAPFAWVLSEVKGVS